jgi:hypothetical protein
MHSAGLDKGRPCGRLVHPLAALGLLSGSIFCFGALAINGFSFTSLVLFSESGFSQIKQFGISGLTAVPIPSALALFVSGIVALGFLGRRRKKPAEVV